MQEKIQPRQSLPPSTLSRESDYLDPIDPDSEPKDWGHWAPTVQLMYRLGATQVRALGDGLGVAFDQFSLETQVYATRAVVAMNSSTRFNLSEGVYEQRAFSLQISKRFYSGSIDIGFSGLPEKQGKINGVELAKRYVVVLTWLLEKHPNLVTNPQLCQLMLGNFQIIEK